MNLTAIDLSQIRTIHQEGNASLEGKADSLEADVKEIYYMIAKMEQSGPSKKFNKLTVEQKVRSVYSDLQTTAIEAGVTLPR